MRIKYIICLATIVGMFSSCAVDKKEDDTAKNGEFNYVVQFADIRVMRYQIPGFDELTLKEKKLVYYLTQAGLAGRDIMWDQNYRHNLKIRKALERINSRFRGDRKTEDFKAFKTYLKRVWFSNGIHHHYSNDKIKPKFSREYFEDVLLKKTSRIDLPREIIDVDITDKEVSDFYKTAYKGPEGMPIEAGLNSKLVREDGKLVEKVWKSGGMYGKAIDQITGWLEKAKEVAENENQAKALGLLIEYYKTGSLDVWDQYCIAWVKSTEGNIDWINGFIEVYNDPKGKPLMLLVKLEMHHQVHQLE